MYIYEHTEIRFFSFPKGESISKEYYEMETLFVMLEGSAKIVYNQDDERVINPGDIIAMESDIEYGVEALSDEPYAWYFVVYRVFCLDILKKRKNIIYNKIN